jgi:hypothetical protein
MQKVVGSNPFSRSQKREKPAFAGLFLRAQSACAFALPDNNWTIAAVRAADRSREPAGLQAILVIRTVNLFCNLQKVVGSSSLRAPRPLPPRSRSCFTGEQLPVVRRFLLSGSYAVSRMARTSSGSARTTANASRAGESLAEHDRPATWLRLLIEHGLPSGCGTAGSTGRR